MSRYKNYNEDYKASLFGMPSVETPEDKKQEKYHMEWAKAMYSHWHHGKVTVPYSLQKDIDRLRQYGRGDQPIEMYLKNKNSRALSSTASDIDGSTSGSKEWLRDGKNNLDLNIISVAPKVKSMIKAYLSNIREDVVVDTIDPRSGAKKDEEKYKLYMYAQNKQFIDAYMRNAGMEQEEPEFLPDNMSELEMYEQAGGFKPIHAMGIELLVKHCQEISGYDDELENDIYDDLLDIGIAATKKKLDPEDLKFKDKYVDPKYLVVQHSRHNDFHDIDWVGHVEFYTISEIRRYMPHLKDEDLRSIAYAYSGRLANPGDYRNHSSMNEHGSYGFDSWKVAVFEAEWIDQESKEAVFYDNKRGKTSMLPVTEETVKGLNDRKRYVKSKTQKLRQCSWIVGTEYCFDFGLANMQDRPAKNKVISNYHIRAVGDVAMMAQMRPVLDDLQMSYLRWQDARANAVKKGYALNLSKLKTIGQGDDKLNVWQILKIWKERGLLLYQDSLDGEYKGGKTLPIDELPNTLLDEIQEFITAWDHALKRMEDLTGINALILGAAPDPDAPVTTQKLSVASSANAIKPLGMAMRVIRRKSAESFMRRFVLAARTRRDILQSYEGVIGKQKIQAIVEASKTMTDYGMSFSVRPTDAEKLEIKQALALSVQNRREGRPGIDISTKLDIEAKLASGMNIKYIIFYLKAMEKKTMREDEARQLRLIQAQSQENAKNAQIANQAQQQQEQMKIQGEAYLEGQRSKGKITEELVKKDDGVAETVAKIMGYKFSGNNLMGGQQSAAQ